MTLPPGHRTLYTDYASIYVSICLPVYLSIYISICLSIHQSIYLHIHLSIYLSIHLSTYLFICLSILKNGKLRDMYKGIWKILTRDSQCRSVQRVSLVVFWTDQKPCETTSQLPLKSILLLLSHSRISIRLLEEWNLICWGWFWMFFCQCRPLLWSLSHFVM